ncbi:hypothetical protein K3G63_22465 [Hymenobacter sp. HSC-4F20]|nr:hypothetical protein [Hymenobacter sp. HSC-4F20]
MSQPGTETNQNETPSPSESAETKPELGATEPENAETKPELSTTKPESAAETPEQNATKPKSKGGRPRKAPDTGVWAVRGVDFETRGILEKAAQRMGKTMGQYFNEEVRAFAQGQIVKSEPQVPASPKDVQNQLDHLTAIVEGLAARIPEQQKQGFWKRLFG